MAKGGVLALAVVVLGGTAAAQEMTWPAELPPAGYAGQQYVDSRGCLFLRAGQPGAVNWVPRVTRDGVPLCDQPPSGGRVPVAGAAEAPVAVAAVEGAAHYVAVGSFGVAANVDAAEARLTALGYPVRRGGGSGKLVTVLAGPFADATLARQAREALLGAFPDAVVVAR